MSTTVGELPLLFPISLFASISARQLARTSIISGHIKTFRGPTYRRGQRPLLGVRSFGEYLEGSQGNIRETVSPNIVCSSYKEWGKEQKS